MKKLIRKSTKPIIKKTRSFETILIRLVFPFKEEEDNIAKNFLLSKTLNGICNKYPTEESFKIALIKNYILRISNGYTVIGTTGFFVYSMVLTDPKIINKNYLEDAIKILYEYVYNPKVINNSLDDEKIERHRKNVLVDIENSQKNLRGYIESQIPNLIDNEGIYRRNITNYKHQLKDVNGKNLYGYYKKIIKSQTPLAFIIGNVDKKNITELINKYFNKKNIKTIQFEKDYEHFLLPCRKEPQIIEEEKEFNQSAVSLIYKVKNFSSNDRIVLNVVKSLLMSTSCRLLFNKLRSEEQLVYSADASNYYFYGFLKIKAYTDRNRLEYAKNKIVEVINDLKNEKIITPMLNNLIQNYKISILESQDSKQYLLDDIMDDFLEVDELPEIILIKLQSITFADINKFVNRLELDTIYYVKERVYE